LSALSPVDRATIQAGSIADWTRESWEIGRDFAYASASEPCGEAAVPVMVAEERVRQLIPIVRRQALRGGLRLARMLDEALA
jgi:hypothetical protein